MKTFSLTVVVVFLISIFASSGCMRGQFYRLGPQSHFAYPNSNVKDLGPIKLKMNTRRTVTPELSTGDNDELVFNRAMAQVAGANIILDYVRSSTVYQFGGMPIYWTEEILEGTAGRMEVGEQGLK